MAVQPERITERVFLVVVDESPEMPNALRYACRRAKRTGGRVAMLYVLPPPEGQQWGSVVDLMRQEARQPSGWKRFATCMLNGEWEMMPVAPFRI